MIAGTVTIEDTSITFAADYSGDVGAIRYTVSDNLTGAHETKTVDSESFLLALGLALSHSGEFTTTKDQAAHAWELADSIQPENPKLRFIP